MLTPEKRAQILAALQQHPGFAQVATIAQAAGSGQLGQATQAQGPLSAVRMFGGGPVMSPDTLAAIRSRFGGTSPMASAPQTPAAPALPRPAAQAPQLNPSFLSPMIGRIGMNPALQSLLAQYGVQPGQIGQFGQPGQPNVPTPGQPTVGRAFIPYQGDYEHYGEAGPAHDFLNPAAGGGGGPPDVRTPTVIGRPLSSYLSILGGK